MIPSRRKFLTTLFASLEANGVRYVLLRNYDNLYADVTTDVDLLISPYSARRFERCLREAAGETGFRFVHAARYVNYSHVYWHPLGGFIRIDFETEVRWRLFTVLPAREVLDARRRYQEFFFPHPRHESVILFVAAIWRLSLSDRYREQLPRLAAACETPEELRRALVEAFGPAGNALAAFQPHAATAVFDRALAKRVRWSLVFAAHRRVRRLRALMVNTWTDVLRLRERLRRPAGISFLFVSSNERPRHFAELMQRIDFLFPAKKCILQSFDLTGGGSSWARWGLRLRWLRLRTLFKGGLFVRSYRLARDMDLLAVIRTHARYLFPSRTFVCAEDSAGSLYFAHVSRGFMATSPPRPASEETDFSRLFIEFISDILVRAAALDARKVPRRGVFCVLAGLDGAGKTTLARNLCELAAHHDRFTCARYFHWRPKLLRSVEFPLPEFRNLPRQAPLRASAFNTILSAARLAKNAALARLAWHWRLRPLLDRGCLVVVDRYLYNYHLDPASVKFTGPAAWLERAERFFPQPDLVLKLGAPAEILLRRKQELSEPEVLRQIAALNGLPCAAGRVADLDAARPAAEVARAAMEAILQLPR